MDSEDLPWWAPKDPRWSLPLVKSSWDPEALNFFNRAPVSNPGNSANVEAMEQVLASDAFTSYYEVMPDGSMRPIEKPVDGSAYIPVTAPAKSTTRPSARAPQTASATGGGSWSLPVLNLSWPQLAAPVSSGYAPSAYHPAALMPPQQSDPYATPVMLGLGVAAAALAAWYLLS